MMLKLEQPCPSCNSLGKVDGPTYCEECSGSGKVLTDNGKLILDLVERYALTQLKDDVRYLEKTVRNIGG